MSENASYPSFSMKFRTLALSLLAVTVIFGGVAARCEEMHWKNLIEKTMDCDNPKGNEIRESQHVSAPEGKAFNKDSVRVTTEPATRSFSDAAGPSGCFLANLDWQTTDVPRHLKSGETVPVPARVLKGFDIRSHADCGSGEERTLERRLKGDKINTTCSASASTFNPD